MPARPNPYHDRMGQFTDPQNAKIFSLRGEVKRAGWNPKDKKVSFGKALPACGRAARKAGGSYVLCTTGKPAPKREKPSGQIEMRGTNIKGIFLNEAMEITWEMEDGVALAEVEVGHALYVAEDEGEIFWAILDEEDEVVESGIAASIEEGQVKAEVAWDALASQVGLVLDPDEQYESLAAILEPLLTA